MHVSLITEGTYPFHDGGVSVWCDQLVRGMAPQRFRVDAITITGTERPKWKLPDNVTDLRQIPLWGPSRMRRSRRADVEVLVALGSLFRATVAPHGSADFSLHLERLFWFAQEGRLQPAFLTEDVVDLMLEAMATQAPTGRFVTRSHGRFVAHNRGATVADAVAAVNLLEHLLRPLAAEPPEVDLCHACSNGLAVLVGMAAKWTRKTPLILTEHGLYLRERYIAYPPQSMSQPQRAFMLSFFKHLTAAAYQVADVIAPGSEYNRRWEEANGAHPAKIRPIYNGVDALSFGPSVADPVVPTVSWVGRIDPLKDVKTLLRAFARVRRSVPDARLRIFGGTPTGNEAYYQACLRLHDQLGLGTSAVFEGRVPLIIDAYHAGHVVLSTSISEGFPYAVLEAMASGRAVVATDVGGVREAVADTGILVPPRDDKRIAEACVELLADSRRRAQLASLGRERVLSMFTLERCLARYREVYDQIDESVTSIPELRADAFRGRELLVSGTPAR